MDNYASESTAQEEAVFDLHISSPEINQHKINLLSMFYFATMENKIGLAEMRNKDTGDVELILTGVEITDGGPSYYPLARVLDASEASFYELLEDSGGDSVATED